MHDGGSLLSNEQSPPERNSASRSGNVERGGGASNAFAQRNGGREALSTTGESQGGFHTAFTLLDAAAFECGGPLRRYPLDGSRPTDVAKACDALSGDADGLVFTAGDVVFALDAGAATPRVVAKGHSARSIAASHAWIYLEANEGIRRVPRR